MGRQQMKSRNNPGMRSVPASGDVVRLLKLVKGHDGAAIERLARRILARTPDDPLAMKALSVGLIKQGFHDDAVEVIDRAIAVAPQDWELYGNLCQPLFATARWEEMAERLSAAAAQFPDNHEFAKNLGIALSRTRRWREAIPVLLRAIELSPSDDFEVIWEIADCLVACGRFEEALPCVKEVFEHDRQRIDALATIIAAKLQTCQWDGIEGDVTLLRELSKGFTKYVGAPLTLLACPWLNSDEWCKVTRLFAQSWIEKKPLDDGNGTKKLRAAGSRLRIGYMSGDFRAHPVGYLVSDVLKHHSRDGFEIYGYALQPPDDSAVATSIRQRLDVFRDLSRLSVRESAQLIRDDNVDILVDLAGWTTYGRSGILSLRPAPIMVNWLGYPGSLGHHALADYIIADAVVIPEDAASLYSEKVVRLDGCYLPYDAGKGVGDPVPRSELGLPDEAFVFCSFNRQYKLNPSVIGLWSRILTAVPGSMLWMSDGGDATSDRLRQEFQVRGVASERLLFSKSVPDRGHHLARIRAADLALDTFPYNSHSTGLDALFAGVPMVTLLGEYFPGRVGASTLSACGLEDLVAKDPDQYVELAIALAKEPGRLAEAKGRLMDPDGRANLFDMTSFTRRLEAAYQMMTPAGG